MSISFDYERWRGQCDKARMLQEAERRREGFKNRLTDPLVSLGMEDVWTQSIAAYGQWSDRLSDLVMLTSLTPFIITPLAEFRVRPDTGRSYWRKRVEIEIQKGQCLLSLGHLVRRYTGIVYFKNNDVLATYIKSVSGRPLMVLFMTRYEGPILLFFDERHALRILLIMMQTQFIEKLRSSNCCDELGLYAHRLFDFAEDQEYYTMEAVEESFLVEDSRLVFTNFAAFFQDPDKSLLSTRHKEVTPDLLEDVYCELSSEIGSTILSEIPYTPAKLIHNSQETTLNACDTTIGVTHENLNQPFVASKFQSVSSTFLDGCASDLSIASFSELQDFQDLSLWELERKRLRVEQERVQIDDAIHAIRRKLHARLAKSRLSESHLEIRDRITLLEARIAGKRISSEESRSGLTISPAIQGTTMRPK